MSQSVGGGGGWVDCRLLRFTGGAKRLSGSLLDPERKYSLTKQPIMVGFVEINQPITRMGIYRDAIIIYHI